MNLIGNQKRWAALARAFTNGKIPHTLLISGPPHVGKTSLVDAYARLLLCPQVTEIEGVPSACGHCKACHQIQIGTYPDYRLYRPIVTSVPEKDWVIASEFLDSSIITVEMARKVTEEALRKPVMGARKVMVIQQIDRMNEEAQNALLKTFEEPPPGTFIVLTTENARKIRETVLSRCWHLPLTPAPEHEVLHWLGEQFPGSKAADLQEAGRAGAGRPGLAWRALQRLQEDESTGDSRFQTASRLVERLDKSAPVGALGLTEEAIRLSKLWWDEDASESGELKKGASKVSRAAAARFLDELMLATKVRWGADPGRDPLGPARLDLMRKTRHSILRNANLNLALDVMFVRLIALRRVEPRGPVH